MMLVTERLKPVPSTQLHLIYCNYYISYVYVYISTTNIFFINHHMIFESFIIRSCSVVCQDLRLTVS